MDSGMAWTIPVAHESVYADLRIPGLRTIVLVSAKGSRPRRISWLRQRMVRRRKKPS
jgi:hypothetical protein